MITIISENGPWVLPNREVPSPVRIGYNVAGQHPDVVATLQMAYDRWWTDISTDFDKPARIVIGSDRANPTAPNPHDWIGRPHELFDQSQVRRGRFRPRRNDSAVAIRRFLTLPWRDSLAHLLVRVIRQSERKDHLDWLPKRLQYRRFRL